jgi:Protein of unknwon function (DUF3310)
VARKKTQEKMQKDLLKKLSATQPAVEVEGEKLPVQPVVLQGVPVPAKTFVEVKKEAWDNAKMLPADYEHVHHPKHYNSHPSGVEAIDLCEVLSFNVGSAFKYVFRRDDKVNLIQDLQKARWYIVQEIALLNSPWRRFLPSWLHFMLLSNPNMSEHHYELADKVRTAEKNTNAKLFYNAILHSTETANYAKQDLPTAIKAIDALIHEHKVAADADYVAAKAPVKTVAKKIRTTNAAK